MTLINDAATAWSTPVKLPMDEVCQARKGSVCVYTTDWRLG